MTPAWSTDSARASQGRRERKWIYRLASLGWELLVVNRRAVDDEHYEPVELRSIVSAEHDLQINALVVSLALAATDDNPERKPLIDAMPFEWHRPRRGTYDPREEEAPEEPDQRTEWSRRKFDNYGRSVSGILKPDATLIGPKEPLEDERQVAVMIEFDRTGRPSKQRNRLHRYERFLLTAWRHSRFALLRWEPAILFVTLTDAQAQGTARLADEELLAYWGRNYETPSHDSMPARRQIGFTTLDKLLKRDWEILQLPSIDQKSRSKTLGGKAKHKTYTENSALDRYFDHEPPQEPPEPWEVVRAAAVPLP